MVETIPGLVVLGSIKSKQNKPWRAPLHGLRLSACLQVPDLIALDDELVSSGAQVADLRLMMVTA